MSTTFSIEDLTTLQKALLSGVKKVQYSDKTVEYQDLNDMIKLYEFMCKQLDDSGSLPKSVQQGRCRVKTLFAQTSKGMGCK